MLNKKDSLFLDKTRNQSNYDYRNFLDIEKRIVQYFLDICPKTLLAIYLTGSRAGKYNRFNSDWDIHLIFSKKDQGLYSSEIENISLDVKTMMINEKNIWSDKPLLKTPYSPAYPFKLMWCNKRNINILKKIEKNTISTYKKGIEKLKIEEKIDKILQLRRFLVAAEQESDINVKLRHLFRSHDLLLQYWYNFNGKFSKTTKMALTEIKNNDKKLYLELKKLNSCNSVNSLILQYTKIYNTFVLLNL